jgi:type I restriction enzyme M protein
VVTTKKTELLFLALFLRLLKPGGKAAVIVPDGVLFGSPKAHKELRLTLVEEHKLDAVVKLPSGVFKPLRCRNRCPGIPSPVRLGRRR